jgi:hypothetical protein
MFADPLRFNPQSKSRSRKCKKSRKNPLAVAQSARKLPRDNLILTSRHARVKKKFASAGIAQRQRRWGVAMRRTSAQRWEEAAPLILG